MWVGGWNDEGVVGGVVDAALAELGMDAGLRVYIMSLYGGAAKASEIASIELLLRPCLVRSQVT